MISADVGAGGGYYLAVAADSIVAHPTSVTGGIGCILNVYNLQDLMGQFNILGIPIKSGANMEMLVKAEGAERILLGTNFAGWDQDDTIVASVEALPISIAERDLIRAGNARRLFGVRH